MELTRINMNQIDAQLQQVSSPHNNNDHDNADDTIESGVILHQSNEKTLNLDNTVDMDITVTAGALGSDVANNRESGEEKSQITPSETTNNPVGRDDLNSLKDDIGMAAQAEEEDDLGRIDSHIKQGFLTTIEEEPETQVIVEFPNRPLKYFHDHDPVVEKPTNSQLPKSSNEDTSISATMGLDFVTWNQFLDLVSILRPSIPSIPEASSRSLSNLPGKWQYIIISFWF